MTTPNGTTGPALPAGWPAAVDQAVDEFQVYAYIAVGPDRMHKARDLAAQGAVQCYDDGTATVTGTTAVYEILDRCPCKDATFRDSIWCKHTIAVWLTKHASKYLKSEDTPDATPAPLWQHAQAPSSCSLKWRARGVEMLLTLRDDTDAGLCERIKHVLPTIYARMEEDSARRKNEAGNT